MTEQDRATISGRLLRDGSPAEGIVVDWLSGAGTHATVDDPPEAPLTTYEVVPLGPCDG